MRIGDPSACPSRRSAALAGVASAAFGLGVAEFVAGWSRSLRSPIVDVGDRVIDHVPASVKDLAIDLFGTNDKQALLVGIGVALAVYAAMVGIVSLRRRLGYGVIGVAIFAAIGILATLGSRTSRVWWSPLPTIAGSLVVLVTLAGFASLSALPARTPTSLGRPSGRSVGRRRFLAMLGAVSAGAVVTAAAGRSLGRRLSVAASRSGLMLPAPATQLAAIPAAAQAPGAASFLTSNADFYRIDTALTVPQIQADAWTLRIHGLVDREIELSFDDLLQRELIERDITLTCVSNTIGGDLVGTARWLGVRLDDVLDEAGIDPTATQIVGRSSDGYTGGFPVSALDGRDALVAVGMNGEPLPLEHGYPARLIVPGLYGYVSATKWLTEIELTTFEAFDHYWVPRGYAVEAPIKLQSRIDTPRGLDRVDPGPFVIGGVAWAQTIGIDAVEVRIDDGDWMAAELADEVNDITWRQWSLPWEATPGRHSITVRAKDRNGAIQTDERSEPLPNGATGHHTVVVLVNDN
ncbi:MAG: molybdopterin-dependent oxidoreductase [Acidimicrobiales bacterium]